MDDDFRYGAVQMLAGAPACMRRLIRRTFSVIPWLRLPIVPQLEHDAKVAPRRRRLPTSLTTHHRPHRCTCWSSTPAPPTTCTPPSAMVSWCALQAETTRPGPGSEEHGRKWASSLISSAKRERVQQVGRASSSSARRAKLSPAEPPNLRTSLETPGD
jgi:hypothetical protein